jgi:hypothetical protein
LRPQESHERLLPATLRNELQALKPVGGETGIAWRTTSPSWDEDAACHHAAEAADNQIVLGYITSSLELGC